MLVWSVRVGRELDALHGKLEQAVRAIQEAAAKKGGEAREEWPAPAGEAPLSPQDAARIEALFAEAQRDRSRALQLKAELDRLGVFARFEDRFLDLFKRGE